MKQSFLTWIFLGVALMTPFAKAEKDVAGLVLPRVISSHMVLQRDIAVPIWGSAAPGEKVTVSFRDQSKSATADNQGKWMVKLSPLKAGGPDTMKITAVNTITLEDILVGEVWVGSGQSNMDLPVAAGGTGLQAAVGANTFPQIRMIITGQEGWQEATPKNVAGFSALLFAFGLPLQQELDVPVGLIEGAVGATPSGYWLSREAYATDPACVQAAQHFKDVTCTNREEMLRYIEATYWGPRKHIRSYAGALDQWEKADAEARESGKQSPPRPDYSLQVNSQEDKIGCLYETRIRPVIPYAIRGVLWDQGESSTAVAGVDQYQMMGALIRGWRKEWGQGDFPFIYVQKPSGGGCAWDYDDPVTRDGGKFAPLPGTPPGTVLGLFSETHIRIMQYPNTAMVISSDLGGGVHPGNKAGYGARALRVALGKVYGRQIEIYGPIFESHKIEGEKVRVKFIHVGKGLAMRHAEKLQGFAIAGADKVFHWADAEIDGDTVVLSSDKVGKPVAIRYGWTGSWVGNSWANLFNKDHLPAIPFRTDTW